MEIVNPKYFPALTGLRFILASLLFIYHYSGYGNSDLYFFQIPIVLRYPMTIFFVLSAFVVMYFLIPKEKLSIKNYVKYILSRLIRLLPVYFLLLFVPYLQVGIPTLPVFLTNITLTKGFFEELFFSGIGPAWSLTPEITFYCLAPLLLIYLPKPKQLLISYGIVLLTGLLFTLIGSYLIQSGYNSYGFFADIYFTLNVTFFGRATDFYVGMALAWFIYKYPDKDLPALLPGKKTYSGLILVILISYLFYILDNLSIAAGPILALICLHLFLPIAVGYFLWGLIKEKTKLNSFLSLKWMIVLGNSAYGFYLMHTSWVQYKLAKINFLPDNCFILLWITAVLVYIFFEKPCMLFLRRNLTSF